MKIALTGGIACGKSLLARYLSSMGLRIIDADDVVHDLESPGGAAVEPIVGRFGDGVRAADGGVDRRALAKVVFGDENRIENRGLPRLRQSYGGQGIENCGEDAKIAREDLEGILFPMVRERILGFLEGTEGTANSQFSILNSQFSMAIIPLLFESHWDADYDIIIALVSEHEAQIRRMAETRGQTREQAEARIAAQMPVAEKAARADYVVRNDSTPEALHAEAVRLVDWLKSRIRG